MAPATDGRAGDLILGGLVAGLLLSTYLPFSGAETPVLVLLGAAIGVLLSVGNTRKTGIFGLVIAAAAATCAGVVGGQLRIQSLEGGALRCCAGERQALRGFVDAAPRRSRGQVRLRIASDQGRVAVHVPEPVPDLGIGDEVVVDGQLRAPGDWEAPYYGRFGVVLVLEASRLRLGDRARDGPLAIVDRVRERAERGVGEGMQPAPAALARGFVLGQDDRIDPRTVEDFKRSGLAHLLAVSGQNVILLAVLVGPILGLLGAGFRGRLLITLALIALYVPVTGAGPSIQRAGIMGAAGIVAALAEQPASRARAVVLAALITLAINPLAAGDVGWQLSFAAVIGILLWARPLRDFVLRRHENPTPVRIAAAEGLAMTVAATAATAPLMAHHFEAVSVAALPANVLALPAVAPVMWLGMLSAIAGQVPGVPTEPMNLIAEPLIGYIAWVASAAGDRSWSLVEVSAGGWVGVVALYVALLCGAFAAGRWVRRREGLSLVPGRPGTGPAVAVGLAVAAALTTAGPASGPSTGPAALGPHAERGLRPDELRLTVLDVGQGDAILLEPGDGDPVLVDAGGPDGGVADELDGRIDRLAAMVATHPQSDHTGGGPDVLAAIEVDALLHAEPDRFLVGSAAARGIPVRRIAAGDRIRSGSLRLEVLWPLPARSTPRIDGGDPNRHSVVLRARWYRFTALLTGDAEASLAPVDPGPIDVLKVAHHGSEDPGLPALLEKARPRLGLISVGGSNPHGHPTAETLAALEGHGVEVARTDIDGSVSVTAGPSVWRWRSERLP